MKQEIDNSLLAECFDAAMKEEILEKDWEIKLWAYSLYNAKMWGRRTR
jgi:hypothetical protein